MKYFFIDVKLKQFLLENENKSSALVHEIKGRAKVVIRV